MVDADKCAACGEIIPEGIQVCPLCSKEVPTMGENKNLYYNSEGYADPTAYGALKPIIQANAVLDSKVNFLIKVLKFIANEFGFDVVNRIELRDRNTGRLFK